MRTIDIQRNYEITTTDHKVYVHDLETGLPAARLCNVSAEYFLPDEQVEQSSSFKMFKLRCKELYEIDIQDRMEPQFFNVWNIT